MRAIQSPPSSSWLLTINIIIIIIIKVLTMVRSVRSVVTLLTIATTDASIGKQKRDCVTPQEYMSQEFQSRKVSENQHRNPVGAARPAGTKLESSERVSELTEADVGDVLRETALYLIRDSYDRKVERLSASLIYLPTNRNKQHFEASSLDGLATGLW
uniref:Uncharacterized protein n=1 Tax=Anopheles culicifacies TaxID=139723 RepID=A0A182MIW7_9DIPT